METQLTDKQRRFAQEYLLDLNGAAAARRAGYSEDSANRIASENLSKLDIQEYIQLLQKERSQRLQISADRVLQEFAKIGFSDVKHYVTEDWQIKPLDEIPLEETAAIQAIKTTVDEGTTLDGKALWKKTKVEFKLHSKQAGLESLAKHLGLYEKDNKQKEPQGITLTITEALIQKPDGD